MQPARSQFKPVSAASTQPVSAASSCVSNPVQLTGRHNLVFNGDLPTYFDPSAASASSPLIDVGIK